MQPPMTPLTERVRIEAEQNALAAEAEWRAQMMSPHTSLRGTIDAFIDVVRRAVSGMYPSQRYVVHLTEKFDETDQTSYS